MTISVATLRQARDIRMVFATGCRVHGRTMVLHARHRGDAGPARCAVVAGRKVGGAVRRNRAKRRLRAVVAAASLPPAYDFAVVARAAAVSSPFDTLLREFGGLLSEMLGQAASRQGVGA